MKKIISAILAVVLAVNVSAITVNAATVSAKEDFRGVWVSTVFNIDYPSKKGLSNEELKKEIDYIVDKTSDMGLNAIMFQVRPAADSFYKSEIFPWSEYLTGTQGKAPNDGFDPLSYIIEKSHAKNIELHAWLNPYRVSPSAEKRTSVELLSQASPARQNPSWVIAYENGLYFDPALPETRQLVISGIMEIVKNYNVDGIHLDDYFYPAVDFPDSASYEKYGNGINKDDWRRENVNELIKGIQKAVKETNPSVVFGISPFGIWQNASSSPLGSDTSGSESYKTMYADTRRWVKEGWIDYICPQIYWAIGFKIADYAKLVSWWSDVCAGTSVDLYIGHAAYKEFANTDGWPGQMVTQLKFNENYNIIKGSVYFSFSSLMGTVGEDIKNYYSSADSYNSIVAPAPKPTDSKHLKIPENITKILNQVFPKTK